LTLPLASIFFFFPNCFGRGPDKLAQTFRSPSPPWLRGVIRLHPMSFFFLGFRYIGQGLLNTLFLKFEVVRIVQRNGFSFLQLSLKMSLFSCPPVLTLFTRFLSRFSLEKLPASTSRSSSVLSPWTFFGGRMSCSIFYVYKPRIHHLLFFLSSLRVFVERERGFFQPLQIPPLWTFSYFFSPVGFRYFWLVPLTPRVWEE